MFNELTQKDIDAMLAEIEHRKCVVRKELLEDVKTARAHGDLSENFEYKAAKQAKNQNESRIRYLEKMVKTAIIIEDKSQEDEVGINKIVELYFEDDDEVEEFKIVTTVRGNSLKNLVSTESPIGKAVLGHKVGDRCYVAINEKAGYASQIIDQLPTGLIYNPSTTIISKEYIFVRYMGPKFVIIFSGVEIEDVERFLKDLKIQIENMIIKLNDEEDEKIQIEETKTKKKGKKKMLMETNSRLNFVLSTYYKGTGLEELLKRLEQYIDTANKDESEINNI